MKKVYINGRHDVEFREEAIPTPGPNEIVVKAKITGISAGTEMMLYEGTFPNFELKKWPQWTDFPVCPGYEMIGTVVAVGASDDSEMDLSRIGSVQPKSSVITKKASDFKVGDRVFCQGEHGEYACMPVEFCAKIPDNVCDEDATLAALGTTSMHAVHRANIEYGSTVAVIGMGVLGNLVMQQAKNAGATRVIALDMDDNRLEIARKCGADLAINTRNTDPIKAILEYNGILPDVVFEVTGAKGTIQTALDLVRDRGKIVVVGWHTHQVEFQFGDFYFKEVELIATRAGGPEAGLPYAYVRWNSETAQDFALEMISKGLITGKYFSHSVFDAKDLEHVYELISKRDPSIGMHVLLKWE